jgi:hypothetical protein
MAPHCNMLPMLVMTPAMTAATVATRVSRFLMWASSCAMTPRTSRSSRMCIRPAVTATAAFAGLRPVANALGCGSSIQNTRGIGQLRAAGELLHHAVQVGIVVARDLSTAVQPQDDLVREVVGRQVHHQREGDDAVEGALADGRAGRDEDRRQQAHQEDGLELVHDRSPVVDVRLNDSRGRARVKRLALDETDRIFECVRRDTSISAGRRRRRASAGPARAAWWA